MSEPVTHVYASPDGIDLHLDVWSPPGPGPHPGVIIIHGGAWRMGDRSQFGPALADWDPPFFAQVAAEGLLVASIDYRLSGQARWPAQLEDVRAAAQWLGDHASDLSLDPKRVGVWGESAGGHLACLLALAGPADQGAVSAVDIRAAVGWYPPTNLATMGAQRRTDAIGDADQADSPEAQLLGCPVQDDLALAAQASPVSYVSSQAPALLLVHGDEDRLVPVGQSEELAEALRANGVEVALVVVPGSDHVWLGVDDVRPIVSQSVNFLRTNLGL